MTSATHGRVRPLDDDIENPDDSTDDHLLGYHHVADWDLLWTKSVYAIKAARQLQPGQVVSAIAGLNCLTMKKRMVQTLRLALGSRAFLIVPLSFCIPEELHAWKAWLASPVAAAADTGLWMLKTGQDAGKGLRLASTQHAPHIASRPLRNPSRPQSHIKVAQQYITNPLLIQGRKFHLRLWLLVTSHSPLRAYLHCQGLVLFSSEAYDTARPVEGVGVRPAVGHVTNYARNEDTWMMGLDYLVDEQLHPWLLEVNSAPSIMAVHTCPKTCQLIKQTKQAMLTDMLAMVQHRHAHGNAWRHAQHAADDVRDDGTGWSRDAAVNAWDVPSSHDAHAADARSYGPDADVATDDGSNAGTDAGTDAGSYGADASQPKRGRKLVKEQKVRALRCCRSSRGSSSSSAGLLVICKNCGTRNTPFWRKDKNDGRPLCNACGLYFAKNDMQRPKVLWKEGEGGIGVPPGAAGPGVSPTQGGMALKPGAAAAAGHPGPLNQAAHSAATVMAGHVAMQGLPNVSTVMVMPAGLGGMLPMGIIDPKLLSAAGVAGLPLTHLLPAGLAHQLRIPVAAAAGAMASSGATTAPPTVQLATMMLQPSGAAAALAPASLTVSRPAASSAAAVAAAAAGTRSTAAVGAPSATTAKLPGGGVAQIVRVTPTANGVALPIPDFAALAAAQANRTLLFVSAEELFAKDYKISNFLSLLSLQKELHMSCGSLWCIFQHVAVCGPVSGVI
eukprot:gene4655-4908_t